MVCDPWSSQVRQLATPRDTSRALASVRGPHGHDVPVTTDGPLGLSVWDPYSGQQLKSMGTLEAVQKVYSFAGPDGHRVLGARLGPVIRVLDLAQPALSERRRLGKVSDEGVRAVAGIPQGKGRPWTVTTAGEGGIRLAVSIGSGPSRTVAADMVGRRARPGQFRATMREISLLTGRFPDLLVGSARGRAILVEADTGRPWADLPVASVVSVKPFPDPAQGNLLAMSTQTEISLWDLPTQQAIGTIPVAELPTWCTAVLPDSGRPAFVIAGRLGLHLFTSNGELVGTRR
jgi:hypothetical protein